MNINIQHKQYSVHIYIYIYKHSTLIYIYIYIYISQFDVCRDFLAYIFTVRFLNILFLRGFYFRDFENKLTILIL